MQILWIATAIFFASFGISLGAGQGTERISEETLPLFHSERRPIGLPEALADWEQWVLWGERHWQSPADFRDGMRRYAVWPSEMRLQLSERGGQFRLRVEVFSKAEIPLPGNAEQWPQEVRINGQITPVLERDRRPVVLADEGTHEVTGVWHWGALPSFLALPPAVGLVQLSLPGREGIVPQLREDSTLLLAALSEAQVAEADSEPAERASAEVYGLLEDGNPMAFELRIRLSVAGKPRELQLGCIVPQGWKLSEFDSPLPAQVTPQGVLTVQARAGMWEIRARAFRVDWPEELAFAEPAPAPQLPLALRDVPHLRQLKLEGAQLFDASQANLPEDWRGLPTYLWLSSEPLRLRYHQETPEKTAPPLRIERRLWLNEDGKSASFLDKIVANKWESLRLDALQGFEPEAAKIVDQWMPVSVNPASGQIGIELRRREFELEVSGRVGLEKGMYAVGWQAKVDSLRVELQLPPAWRLLAIRGAEWSSGDWLGRWNLLDVFLAFLLALAAGQLRGALAGLLALVVFGLTHGEPQAPKYVWFGLLPAVALLDFVRRGWFRGVVVAWKWAAAVGLVILLAPFVTNQIRAALFPQLEELDNQVLFELKSAMREEAAQMMEGLALPAAMPAPAQAMPRLALMKRVDAEAVEWEPALRVPTGRGTPDWSWRTAHFGWSNPISSGARVEMFLIPPQVERWLSALRALLPIGLLWWLLRQRKQAAQSSGSDSSERQGASVDASCTEKKAEPPPLPAWVLALLLLLWMIGLNCQAQASPMQKPDESERIGNSIGGLTFPSDSMLEELRRRLLKPPEEFPNAATIPLAVLQLDGTKLMLDVEIHAAAACAVPLPARLEGWVPMVVRVEGFAVPPLLRSEGCLWIALPRGVWSVRVEGEILRRERWVWSYLLAPKRVQAIAPGWEFRGIGENGKPDKQIVFTVKGGEEEKEGRRWIAPKLESALLLEREVKIGANWRMVSRMLRVSAEGVAASVRVPLFPGERVIGDAVRVANGAVEVNLDAERREVEWVSEWDRGAGIELQMPAEASWAETWQLEVSPFWVARWEADGVVSEVVEGEVSMQRWLPQPGQRVRILLERPQMIASPAVTIQRAVRTIQAGQGVMRETLQLEVMSGAGGSLAIELPAGVQVEQVMREGERLQMVGRDGKLDLPVRPGESRWEIQWTSLSEKGWQLESKPIKLDGVIANAETILQLGAGRWVLWAWGPRMGPAVGFWAVVAAAVIAAVVLSRLPNSPLRFMEWLFLNLGLTQIPTPVALGFVGWVFLWMFRGSERYRGLGRGWFNFGQVVLWVSTPVALVALVWGVSQGLLGNPQDYLGGDGSSAEQLRWYAAMVEGGMPRVGAAWVPLWVHKLLMLGWALWLANALVRWLRQFWMGMHAGGVWRGKG